MAKKKLLTTHILPQNKVAQPVYDIFCVNNQRVNDIQHVTFLKKYQ